jgi:mono/diheme cytochrome c family protein
VRLNHSIRNSPSPVTFAALTLLGALHARAASADEPTGAAIYQQKCARCHGKAGEGAKAFPRPLIGNRSAEQLVKYIAKKMPEDAPGTCTGAEAEKVAAYIFDAFYSPAAQARNKTPRVELARLTVSEYRNAVADLVGTFPPAKAKSAKDEQGLRGEYFTSSGKRKRALAFARVDPVVHFDFAATTPEFDKLNTPEIAATWQGSVIAIETGLYDFVVRTEHSTRLWVNDMKKPLIDKAVKSGSDTEFHGSIYLLGGRPYPLRLEFSRGSVGVRKDPKDKLAMAKTTLSLAWIAPRRSIDVIPQRNLIPETVGTSFALSIALPADDRSAGYERGTAVSKAWVQATTDGAIETASYVAANLAELSGVGSTATDRKKRLEEYCVKFCERAFRRPLTTEQKKLYVDRQFEAAKDPEGAVKRVVLLVMHSPRFLYREAAADSAADDAYDIASRLSFGLWDTLPDDELNKAAVTGRLKSREDIIREARRMSADRKARTKMRSFLLRWLQLDQVAELAKEAKHFPGFDAGVVSDLQTSLDLFLDEVVWSAKSDFRELLLAEHLYLNGRLAKLYGADLSADAPFQKVTLKSGERAGVLTHPFLLANYAYAATSSPIHRGVFLARNVLGVAMRPPPDAFTPFAPELHPKLNTRERITLQTSPKDCRSCHGVINPLGFTLEGYDAIGRWRDQENAKPIDASGSFTTRGGKTENFSGARELAGFLAKSEEAHEAFVARLFHFMVRQPILAYGPDKLTELRRYFTEHDCNVRELVIEIIAQTALAERGKRPAEGGRIP